MPDFYLSRAVFRTIVLLSAAAVVSACGQRGPLYLPKAEAVATPAKPVPALPANPDGTTPALK